MYLDSSISPAEQIRDSGTFRRACVLRSCNFEEVLCAIGICYFIMAFIMKARDPACIPTLTLMQKACYAGLAAPLRVKV